MSYHDLRSTADVEQRFSYHPVTTPERQAQHQAVRDACKRLAHALDRIVPPGRHKALALTAVEESMHWANAAVACQAEPAPEREPLGVDPDELAEGAELVEATPTLCTWCRRRPT